MLQTYKSNNLTGSGRRVLLYSVKGIVVRVQGGGCCYIVSRVLLLGFREAGAVI
jgi:hypothetical protein